jgi:hypothetical protein
MNAMCGLCGSFYNQQCTHWPSCSPAPDPVWEYQVEGVDQLTSDAHGMLNALGDQGWELVGMSVQPNGVTAFVFKRRKP